MRCRSATVKQVRVITRKRRWLTWSCCGALVLTAALLTPFSRADVPAERAPTKSSAQERTQAAPVKAKAKASAAAAKKKPTKESVKAKKKEKAPQRKVASERPRAPKQQPALDVDTGPDQACHAQLRKAGASFLKVLAERAPNVHLPIRLTGPVAGVEIRGSGKKITHYLDCRLGLALVRWAPQLKAAGVTAIDHYSIYRPEAQVASTRKASGHALAMAIDAGRFHMRDGRIVTVLDQWIDKTKGIDPCQPRPQHGADERMMRDLVCNASRDGIFQTVVTPHHNPDHHNHVHLEVSATFAPTWIH